jgi:hypothetical protein
MIIKGYKGVMDLDLSQIDPREHQHLIAQHKKDISDYKEYQSRLSIENRYENTIGKVLEKWKTYDEIQEKKNEIIHKIQNDKFEHMLQVHKANELFCNTHS